MEVDLVIVGSGPVGLYAAYYAGFRGLSTAIVDSLPEPGGQISALYPEKLIHDVAGLPAIRGRDLVNALLNQANKYRPGWYLNSCAHDLERLPDGRLRLTTTRHEELVTRAVVLAAGLGTFTPRRLPAEGDRVDYFVSKPDDYAGHHVLVVGGGDSAVDWALAVELDCTRVMAALGFTADLGPLTGWGLTIVDRHIVVDSTMNTGVPGIYAAGDVTEYPGKVRLISVGFGEAALAVNNAAVATDPTAQLFPGHSTAPR